MSELFNPLEHLVARKDAADQFQWEYLERNGLPVQITGSDGHPHKVLVAKRYLPVNGYRQWFYTKYPEGSIFVEDITPNPVLSADKFVEYPSYKILVTLFADQEHKKVIATGYGTYSKTKKYNPLEEKYSYVEKSEGSDNYLLCQALAIKNAMANAGFIIDFNEEVLNAPECQFLEFDYTMLEASPSEEVSLDAKAFAFPEPVAQEVATDDEVKIKVMTKEEIMEFASDAEPQETSVELPKASVDPVLAFLSKQEPEPKASIVETSEAETMPEESFNPEEVIFRLADGVESTPAMDAYVGKRIGEIDPNKIRYFAKKPNLSKILSEETVKAIIAVA